jgi:nicotinamide riboside transporter PnuC
MTRSHPDTYALTMVNNVIGVVNYVIAARPSLLNFMTADSIEWQAGTINVNADFSLFRASADRRESRRCKRP